MLRVHKKKSSIERGVQAVTYAHTHWKLPTSQQQQQRVERTLCATFKKKFTKNTQNIHFKDSRDESFFLLFFFRRWILKKEISHWWHQKWNWKCAIVWQSNNPSSSFKSSTLFNALSYSMRKLSLRKWKKSGWTNVIKVPRFILLFFFDIDCKMAFLGFFFVVENFFFFSSLRFFMTLSSWLRQVSNHSHQKQ